MSPADTHRRALRGELSPLPSIAETPWEVAERALHALLNPDPPPAVSVQAVATCLKRDPGEAGARAFEHRLVAAWIGFEPSALRDLVALTPGSGPAAARRHALARALAALFAGNVDDAMDLGGRVAEDAAKARDATMVLLAACLRALAALEHGETKAAVELARRASRMARTEGALPHEYVANLVLARARRSAGHPHLAVRVTTALALVVPPAFREWVEWEACLAGEARRGPHGLVALVDAARDGDRDRFDQARAQLEDRFAGCAPRCGDVARFVAMLDVRQPAPHRLEAWRGGEVSEPPWGVRPPHDPSRPIAFVLGHDDGRPGQRLAQAGLGLLPGVSVVETDRHKAQRAQTALAILMGVGARGMGATALFEAIYGFAPVPVKHDGVFRVVLHRARKALGEGGSIDAVDDRLVLRLERPMAVSDPRCRLPLSEHVLALVGAGRRGMSARAVARHLKLPLRTVQAVLGELVDDGVCTAERDGRRVTYVVEDTTFHEPTLHRLIPTVG